jgi:hypothetical protein
MKFISIRKYYKKGRITAYALTQLYEKTKDIWLVQEVAGHADISTK